MKFRVEWNYPGKTMVSGLWEKLSTLPYTQQSHVIVCASIFRYCVRAWKCVRTYTGITIWKLGTLYWRKCKWMSSFMTLTWQYITPYNLKDKKHWAQFDILNNFNSTTILFSQKHKYIDAWFQEVEPLHKILNEDFTNECII